MDKIKIYTTVDNRDIVLLGRNFADMLRLVKAIPGAKFVGTVTEYGEVRKQSRWEVPYTAQDVQAAYGPFKPLYNITFWQFDYQQEANPTSEKELGDLLNAPTNPEAEARREAYRAGRDGENYVNPNEEWYKLGQQNAALANKA